MEGILKAHEDADKKSKTQTELLTQELKRMQSVMEAKEGELKARDLEIRKRDVRRYFEEAQSATGIKVIEPILEEFRRGFYELNEASVSPEQLKEQVTQALAKAQELQKGELARLGINGITPNRENPSFGGGFTEVKPSTGVQFNPNANITDFDAIMRQTSASPMGAPLGMPPTKR